jgi:hypothetical protein
MPIEILEAAGIAASERVASPRQHDAASLPSLDQYRVYFRLRRDIVPNDK